MGDYDLILRDGDTIRMQMPGGRSQNVRVEFHPEDESIARLNVVPMICPACNENDAEEYPPFCITCIEDAITMTFLEDVIDNAGSQFDPGQIIEWDYAEARNAHANHEQYIEFRSNMIDTMQGESPDQFAERITHFVRRMSPVSLRND